MKNDVFLNKSDVGENAYMQDIARVDTSGTVRASTAAGSTRGESRGGSTNFASLTTDDGFGFLFSPSRPSTSSNLNVSSRNQTPVRTQGRGLSLAPAIVAEASLPPINKSPGDTAKKTSPKSIHTSVVPLWFVSAGDIYVDWALLPGGNKLQLRLNALYEHRKMKEYCKVLEIIIGDLWSTHSSRAEMLADAAMLKFSASSSVSSSIDHVTSLSPATTKKKGQLTQELPVNTLKMLWRQLITVANAMGIMAIEKKDFVEAHELLHAAEGWCQRRDLLSKRDRREQYARVQDSLAYYFFRRRKLSSALTLTQKALEIYEALDMHECVGMCLLRVSTVQCLQSNFKESHRVRTFIHDTTPDTNSAYRIYTNSSLWLRTAA
jgi:hypothetical protein